MRRARALVALQAALALGLGTAWWATPSRAPYALLAFSLALLVAALLLAGSAVRSMGPHFRVLPIPRPGAPLQDRGVYARWRHPMYSAASWASLALALSRPSTATLSLAVANLVFYLAKARFEEAHLRRVHADYETYARSTWGVWPLSALRARPRAGSR